MIKKNFTPPLKKFNLGLIFTSFLAVSLLVYSCQKENTPNFTASKANLMAEARSFFENDVAPLTSRNSQNNIGNKNPLWQQAAMVTTSLGNAIAVPIRYQNPIALQAEGEKTIIELQKTSYLLIYKDNNQNMQAEWVSLAPMGEKKNGKFVGIVDIKTWDGEFKRGYAFGQNGQVASVSLNSMVVKQISTAREKECYTIAKWGGISVGNRPFVWRIVGYDTYCIEIRDNRNNLSQSVEQEGDDFGGGTGDGPAPEDYTEILDCAGVPGGKAIFSEECKKCIGGTTGIEKCADIKHELDSFPCAKELVLQMSTLNSDISTLIKNAFDKNDNINLIIKADFTLVGTNTDGQTGEIKGVQIANKLISYNATIGINPDILRSSTKEYILVTIYHEALHAYLGYKKLQLGVTEFNHQFTGLHMNGGRLIGVQDPDHWTMGYAKFVSGLKNIILAFNPNFSEDRAYALAKGGIMTLSPSENLINQQERNTSFTGYKGTKCP